MRTWKFFFGSDFEFRTEQNQKLSTIFTPIREISRANSEGSNYDDGDEDDVLHVLHLKWGRETKLAICTDAIGPTTKMPIY